MWFSQAVAGLLAGVLFGAGLAFGGMTDPAVVQGFLDLAGAWNPALIGVMGGAVVVTFLGYRALRRLPHPALAQAFAWPKPGRADAALWLGAAVFGAGWGLSGYCPGPALAALPSGWQGSLVFVAGMFAGLGAIRLWRSRATSAAAPRAPATVR